MADSTGGRRPVRGHTQTNPTSDLGDRTDAGASTHQHHGENGGIDSFTAGGQIVSYDGGSPDRWIQSGVTSDYLDAA